MHEVNFGYAMLTVMAFSVIYILWVIAPSVRRGALAPLKRELYEEVQLCLS